MTPFRQRTEEVAKLTTAENIDECLARAHAESERARKVDEKDPAFYAWNRVIRALWECQGLEAGRLRSQKVEGA